MKNKKINVFFLLFQNLKQWTAEGTVSCLKQRQKQVLPSNEAPRNTKTVTLL
jgi:hypothetical protein